MGTTEISITIIFGIHASASTYLDEVAGGPESFSVDARLVREKTKSFGQNISLLPWLCHQETKHSQKQFVMLHLKG